MLMTDSQCGGWVPEHIEELPLLAASPQMETIPLASKSWQPSHEVPGGRGGEVGTCHSDKVSRIKGGVREEGLLITKLMHNNPVLVIESSTR